MPVQKTTLTHFRFCPHSRAIRLLLAELGIDPQLAELRPWEWSKELLELNPSGDLPVLQLESVGEGDGTILRGSYAISEFLAATRAVVSPNETETEGGMPARPQQIGRAHV